MDNQLFTQIKNIPKALCAICNDRQCIYTCPRCSTKTCSLSCSSTHKSRTGCTGVRNRAAYVPMNNYGWGTMMDDYVFLEDVGRKIGDWGREIVRGGYGRGLIRGRPTSGRARGRAGWGTSRGTGTKRDMLKMQLELRDIEIDLLPAGMTRCKLNQSRWDFKNKTALLTIEFRFHRPHDHPLGSPDPDPPFVLLTHKNDIEMPLLSIIQAHVKERAPSNKKNAVPRWVRSLVFPHPDDPDSFSPPQCVMPAKIDPLSSVALQVKTGCYNMTPTEKLLVLLRGTHFVEFPTIEIWEEYRGTIVDNKGTITQHAATDRHLKRRKLNQEEGKIMMDSLVGGYGSEDEEEHGGQPAALSALGGYAGSDDDDDKEEDRLSESDEVKSEGDLDADVDVDGIDMGDDEGLKLEPSALLELMRNIQGEAKLDTEAEDDDDDWRSSDEG